MNGLVQLIGLLPIEPSLGGGSAGPQYDAKIGGRFVNEMAEGAQVMR